MSKMASDSIKKGSCIVKNRQACSEGADEGWMSNCGLLASKVQEWRVMS